MTDESKSPQDHKQNVVKLKLPQKPQLDDGDDTSSRSDEVLREALGKLSGVILLGYTDEKDEMEYFATSIEDSAEVVWLLERFKYHLISESSDP
jgi:hypothetical protein